ncbi:hypothetical protein C1H46_030052 [Malus baccata]|uniref:Uncharacterized protein n=1 Tax=Malus baccata TaxID=106549 RepID=A0A540LD36_MALBA|nr:hypothetical protein C1H46_030052 [Malus baccata]
MVGIYYCRVPVVADYRKKTFARVTLNSTLFFQGHKNTTILHSVLVEGQGSVVVGESDISMF